MVVPSRRPSKLPLFPLWGTWWYLPEGLLSYRWFSGTVWEVVQTSSGWEPSNVACPENETNTLQCFISHVCVCNCFHVYAHKCISWGGKYDGISGNCCWWWRREKHGNFTLSCFIWHKTTVHLLSFYISLVVFCHQRHNWVRRFRFRQSSSWLENPTRPWLCGSFFVNISLLSL